MEPLRFPGLRPKDGEDDESDVFLATPLDLTLQDSRPASSSLALFSASSATAPPTVGGATPSAGPSARELPQWRPGAASSGGAPASSLVGSFTEVTDASTTGGAVASVAANLARQVEPPLLRGGAPTAAAPPAAPLRAPSAGGCGDDGACSMSLVSVGTAHGNTTASVARDLALQVQPREAGGRPTQAPAPPAAPPPARPAPRRFPAAIPASGGGAPADCVDSPRTGAALDAAAADVEWEPAPAPRRAPPPPRPAERELQVPATARPADPLDAVQREGEEVPCWDSPRAVGSANASEVMTVQADNPDENAAAEAPGTGATSRVDTAQAGSEQESVARDWANAMLGGAKEQRRPSPQAEPRPASLPEPSAATTSNVASGQAGSEHESVARDWASVMLGGATEQRRPSPAAEPRSASRQEASAATTSDVASAQFDENAEHEAVAGEYADAIMGWSFPAAGPLDEGVGAKACEPLQDVGGLRKSPSLPSLTESDDATTTGPDGSGHFRSVSIKTLDHILPSVEELREDHSEACAGNEDDEDGAALLRDLVTSTARRMADGSDGATSRTAEVKSASPDPPPADAGGATAGSEALEPLDFSLAHPPGAAASTVAASASGAASPSRGGSDGGAAFQRGTQIDGTYYIVSIARPARGDRVEFTALDMDTCDELDAACGVAEFEALFEGTGIVEDGDRYDWVIERLGVDSSGPEGARRLLLPRREAPAAQPSAAPTASEAEDANGCEFQRGVKIDGVYYIVSVLPMPASGHLLFAAFDDDACEELEISCSPEAMEEFCAGRPDLVEQEDRYDRAIAHLGVERDARGGKQLVWRTIATPPLQAQDAAGSSSATADLAASSSTGAGGLVQGLVATAGSAASSSSSGRGGLVQGLLAGAMGQVPTGSSGTRSCNRSSEASASSVRPAAAQSPSPAAASSSAGGGGLVQGLLAGAWDEGSSRSLNRSTLTSSARPAEPAPSAPAPEPSAPSAQAAEAVSSAAAASSSSSGGELVRGLFAVASDSSQTGTWHRSSQTSSARPQQPPELVAEPSPQAPEPSAQAPEPSAQAAEASSPTAAASSSSGGELVRGLFGVASDSSQTGTWHRSSQTSSARPEQRPEQVAEPSPQAPEPSAQAPEPSAQAAEASSPTAAASSSSGGELVRGLFAVASDSSQTGSWNRSSQTSSARPVAEPSPQVPEPSPQAPEPSAQALSPTAAASSSGGELVRGLFGVASDSSQTGTWHRSSQTSSARPPQQVAESSRQAREPSPQAPEPGAQPPEPSAQAPVPRAQAAEASSPTAAASSSSGGELVRGLFAVASDSSQTGSWNRSSQTSSARPVAEPSPQAPEPSARAPEQASEPSAAQAAEALSPGAASSSSGGVVQGFLAGALPGSASQTGTWNRSTHTTSEPSAPAAAPPAAASPAATSPAAASSAAASSSSGGGVVRGLWAGAMDAEPSGSSGTRSWNHSTPTTSAAPAPEAAALPAASPSGRESSAASTGAGAAQGLVAAAAQDAADRQGVSSATAEQSASASGAVAVAAPMPRNASSSAAAASSSSDGGLLQGLVAGVAGAASSRSTGSWDRSSRTSGSSAGGIAVEERATPSAQGTSAASAAQGLVDAAAYTGPEQSSAVTRDLNASATPSQGIGWVADVPCASGTSADVLSSSSSSAGAQVAQGFVAAAAAQGPGSEPTRSLQGSKSSAVNIGEEVAGIAANLGSAPPSAGASSASSGGFVRGLVAAAADEASSSGDGTRGGSCSGVSSSAAQDSATARDAAASACRPAADHRSSEAAESCAASPEPAVAAAFASAGESEATRSLNASTQPAPVCVEVAAPANVRRSPSVASSAPSSGGFLRGFIAGALDAVPSSGSGTRTRSVGRSSGTSACVQGLPLEAAAAVSSVPSSAPADCSSSSCSLAAVVAGGAVAAGAVEESSAAAADCYSSSCAYAAAIADGAIARAVVEEESSVAAADFYTSSCTDAAAVADGAIARAAMEEDGADTYSVCQSMSSMGGHTREDSLVCGIIKAGAAAAEAGAAAAGEPAEATHDRELQIATAPEAVRCEPPMSEASAGESETAARDFARKLFQTPEGAEGHVIRPYVADPCPEPDMTEAQVQELKAAFEQADGDGDGKVTKPELVQALMEKPELAHVFGIDPRIMADRQLALSSLCLGGHVEQLLKAVDSDDDRKVSLEELVDLHRREAAQRAAESAIRNRDLRLVYSSGSIKLILGLPASVRPDFVGGGGREEAERMGPYRFSVAPALPRGLELDPQSGEVVGAAEERADLKAYEVTARPERAQQGALALRADLLLRVVDPLEMPRPPRPEDNVRRSQTSSYRRAQVQQARAVQNVASATHVQEKKQACWAAVLAGDTGDLQKLIRSGEVPAEWLDSPEVVNEDGATLLDVARKQGDYNMLNTMFRRLTRPPSAGGCWGGAARALPPIDAGGGGSPPDELPPPTPKPPMLQYPTMPQVLTLGQKCHHNPQFSTAVPPGIATADTLALFKVAPPLPQGMHLDSRSGQVRGAPEKECPRQTYVVSMVVREPKTDEVTKAEAPFSLRVVETLTSISYPSVERLVDIASSRESGPQDAGRNFGATQPLSARGPPSRGGPFAATAPGGFGGGAVALTARRPPPSAAATLVLRPEVSGGKPERFEVHPPLPQGMMLDPTSGVLEGLPTAQRPLTHRSTHTIVAENSVGSVMCKICVEAHESGWGVKLVRINMAKSGEAVGAAATRAIGAPAAAGSHLEADWERILRKCEAILERNAQPVTICAGPGGFAGPTKVIRALEAQALARSVGFPAEDLDDAGMLLFREVRRRAGGAVGGRTATAGGPPGGGNKTRLSVLERPDGTQLVCLEAGAPTPAERLALSSAGGVGAGSLGGSLAGTGPLRVGSSGGRQGGDALPRMPRGVGFDEEPRHSESHSFRDVQVLLPPVPRLAPEVTKQFSSLMPAWRSKLNAEQERSSKRMLRHERGRLFRQMGEHDDRKHADLL